MSLMLKGVNLPKKGEYLRISILDDGAVFIATSCSQEIEKVVAIQIPKGHGNIIDESKAVVTETIDGYYEITAPTILKAEE